MFLQNKYSTWYNNIISVAQSQGRKRLKRDNPDFIYYEKHHIIPQCMGGKETVLLTAKEHYICHLLLCKMTTGSNRHKMINALIKMSFSKSNGQERYTSKSYSLIKILIAQKNSEQFKGIPKSNQMRKRLSKSRKGMKFSEQHKINIGLSQKGKPKPLRTKEHCENIRKAHLGKKQKSGTYNPFKEKITCNVCHRTGNLAAMKRWHFTNCKFTSFSSLEEQK